MKIDKITLEDLSIFKGDQAVFSLINRCVTQEGTGVLRHHVLSPPKDLEELKRYQESVGFWTENSQKWPAKITNGTIVMLQKFYETADLALDKPNFFNLLLTDVMQKLFKKNHDSFAIFSISHLVDFIKGCSELTGLLALNPPVMVKKILEELLGSCQTPLARQIIQTHENTSNRQWLQLGYYARKQMKATAFKMIRLFSRLDALRSMALAGLEHQWPLPELLSADSVRYEAKGLIHPLLTHPIGYDIFMDNQKYFLFLTGANMSGKSTMLYALGIGALLAHLGMGIPAKEMRISFLEGIVTNMHIEDNVVLGESYFFAEVQRMKQTAQKLRKNKHLLVLMDELFKGTNGYDAFECSLAVIKALLNKRENLMVLSTHLSELSEHLVDSPGIFFRYFHTQKDDLGHYDFTYQLKEGVSKERIGFLVLKKEGVLNLLNN